MKNVERAAVTAACLLLFAPLTAEKITFSADQMSGVAGDKTDRTTLEGNAYVLTSSMEITADQIEMSGSNFRYITATGTITGKNLNTKMDFTCGRMTYDRETKIAVLKDTVHLEDTENKVTADAQIIEYNQNTDIAILQIDITLKQKDNVCTGAYAVYRKKQQMLELSGNAQIKQGKDTFQAQEITLNLDTQEISLDGRVKGTVVDDRKEDKKKSAADAPDTETAPETDTGGTPPSAAAPDQPKAPADGAADAPQPAAAADTVQPQETPQPGGTSQ